MFHTGPSIFHNVRLQLHTREI